MRAARHGHTATVTELVRLGANPDPKNSVRIQPVLHGLTHALQDGFTALLDAVAYRHPATVAELGRLGADMNARNEVRLSCPPRTPSPCGSSSDSPTSGVRCTAQL